MLIVALKKRKNGFSLFFLPGIELAQFPKVEISRHTMGAYQSFRARSYTAFAAVQNKPSQNRPAPVVVSVPITTAYRCAFSSGLTPASIEIHGDTISKKRPRNKFGVTVRHLKKTLIILYNN